MVRTGVVNHPRYWPFQGYNEILNPPKRYSIIKKNTLMTLCGIQDPLVFKEQYKQWVDTELQTNTIKRDNRWTECLAVGSKEFIEKYIQHFDQNKRKITNTNGSYQIREPNSTYSTDFIPKMDALRGNNRCEWINNI